MSLSHQANACEAATRIVGGGLKPSASEKAHLVARLKEASETLRWLERNEQKVRAAVSRVAE